jgi:hypothetical protein
VRGEAIGAPHFDSHFKALDKKLAGHSRAIFAHQLLQRGIFACVTHSRPGRLKNIEFNKTGAISQPNNP